MRIGVLCALEVESRPLAAEISVQSQETVAGTHVERGAKHGHDIFLCTFGVGPTAAAAAAQLLEPRADSQLNSGEVKLGA